MTPVNKEKYTSGTSESIEQICNASVNKGEKTVYVDLPSGAEWYKYKGDAATYDKQEKTASLSAVMDNGTTTKLWGTSGKDTSPSGEKMFSANKNYTALDSSKIHQMKVYLKHPGGRGNAYVFIWIRRPGSSGGWSPV